MDPYSTLGLSRGCTRRQVKEAFRTLVHRAHPDRGGDGEAFVRLCAAYRAILDELDGGEEAPAAPDRRAEPSAGAEEARANYLDWVRRISAESARRSEMPWWRKHPSLAKAGLLSLIGLCGVLVVYGALRLGATGTARRTPRAVPGSRALPVDRPGSLSEAPGHRPGRGSG